MYLVDPIDAQQIIDRRGDFSPFNLRGLFFPDWDADFVLSKSDFTGLFHRLNETALKELKLANQRPQWPILASAVTVDGRIYAHRRPEFLAQMRDRDYCNLYFRLASMPVAEAQFPEWDPVMHFDCQHTGPNANAMLHHVVDWICPEFRVARTSARGALNWTWDNVLAEKVLPSRKITHVRRPRSTNIRDNPVESAKDFVDCVWKYVRCFSFDLELEQVKPFVSTRIPRYKS